MRKSYKYNLKELNRALATDANLDLIDVRKILQQWEDDFCDCKCPVCEEIDKSRNLKKPRTKYQRK